LSGFVAIRSRLCLPAVLLLAVTTTSTVMAIDVTQSDSLAIDSAGLPPRTLIAAPPARPVPRWLKTNLRIGHLPGYDDRMVKEFLKAGYNVVTELPRTLGPRRAFGRDVSRR